MPTKLTPEQQRILSRFRHERHRARHAMLNRMALDIRKLGWETDPEIARAYNMLRAATEDKTRREIDWVADTQGRTCGTKGVSVDLVCARKDGT